ncbi:Cholecystokinin receptor type A [Mizuhopecten yessoensis]|uniref:Cholecystokinin receptor type A n=2 Tax=Mizuhopecten yessoensis TaxID=6573 RepID=A0A210QZQ5_MIZYE|nr:Cholecystokinin receptor type A [Mizuhopecten yessoensis]
MNVTSNSLVMANQLEDWNDELSQILVPDSVILMIYLVVGVLGNSIVIYIHTVRLQSNREERFFIPVLAVVDLISCVVSTAFSFSINMLPVKYNNDSACKIMFFLNMTCSLMAALMLVVIAMHRHRKICKPFSKQLNMFWKKIAIVCIAGVSLVISWPCFLFYGSKEVYKEESLTIGYRCTNVRGPWSTVQPLVFKAAVMLLVAFILVSLVVFYVLIGIVVFRQMRFHKKQGIAYGASDDRSQNTKSPNSNSGDSSYVTEVPDKNSAPKIDTQKSSEADISSPIDNNAKSLNMVSDSDQKSSSNIGHNQRRSTTCKSALTIDHTTRNTGPSMTPGVRLSLIFMLITLVFIVCYVPKVGLMIYESRNENFWIELPPSELSGFRFLYTAFIINNIVNPIIYGFLDRRFRDEVYGLCPCVKK